MTTLARLVLLAAAAVAGAVIATTSASPASAEAGSGREAGPTASHRGGAERPSIRPGPARVRLAANRVQVNRSQLALSPVALSPVSRSQVTRSRPESTPTPGRPVPNGNLLFNRYPTVAPVLADPGLDGVVTGNLGAADADGDRLTYALTGYPALGRVEIDQATGDFTYTPVVDLAGYGGIDSFTVAVRDDTAALHGLQGLLNAPADLLRSVPFLGSLLSDYLPVTTTTATVTLTFDNPETVTDMVFPAGFHWGVSSAGFQSEMGGGAPLDVNSDWWQWTHDPVNRLLLGWKGAVPEGGPGAYTRYPVDIALARDGVNADTFRMGIEWSRIFPTSTAAVDVTGGITAEALQQLDALADRQAVEHYRDVLTAMRTAGLDPMVTVNHFTLPLWVHDPAQARLRAILGGAPETLGGWLSPVTVTEFEKYAAYLAWQFGPEVDNWVVLNEPVNSMLTSYYAIPLATNFPPALTRSDLVAAGLLNQAAAYSASYDLIHRYDDDAAVGFALNMYSWRPANPENPVDQRAAASFSEFYNRWFPDAVIRGQVDADFDGVIAPDEVHPELAGRADFFGVNYYSQGIVAGYGGVPDPALPVVAGYPEFSPLLNVVAGGCPAAECSDTAQIVHPAGLRDVLDIANSYRIPLWITENGLADAADDQRPSYLVRHLAVVHQAIADGMDIRGYIAWALTDNLEWVLGYDPRYGLYSYDPVTLERTARPSAGLVRGIYGGNAIPADTLRGTLAAPRG